MYDSSRLAFMKETDKHCFSLQDKMTILINQQRTVMNMIPVNFETLILDDQAMNIDIFDSIESLNG